MKVANVLKNVGVSVLVVMLVGCASVGSVQNKIVNNNKSGIIYGTSGIPKGDDNTEVVCKAINNKDYRCANSSEYVVLQVISKAGYADGGVGVYAFVKKDFPNLEVLKHDVSVASKNATFVKVKVVAGQLGELLEIVSTSGDGKCYWSGLPSVGGVVCPAYGYDYRKDFIGIVFN